MQVIEVIDLARSILNEPLDSSRVFPDNTSSFWGDTTLLSFFNIIQQEVAAEINQTYEDFFVTQTFLSIVNGTAEYTLPDKFVKMRRVEDARTTSSLEISPVTMNQRGSTLTLITGSGTINGNSYYLRGNQIVFTNTPTFTDSAAIRLQYVQRLVDLSAGSLTSEIPQEHHRVLVWGIVKLCHYSQQANDAMINMASGEFKKQVEKLVSQCEDRQVQAPRRVIRSYQKGFT